jgi:hypothetical protein
VVVPATASAFGSAAIANTIAYGPEAGLKAGVFAAAFAFVGGSEAFGELKKVTAERVIAHAVLGCVQQASSGGQCGPGAAAAAFGKIATGLTQGLGEAAQFAVTTVVGGTVSVIGGGKFANGAGQAAFGYLFNQLSRSAKQQGFGTMNDAAMEGSRRIFGPSMQDGVEFGGLIYRLDDGSFAITDATRGTALFVDPFKTVDQVPGGLDSGRIVGAFHSHPRTYSATPEQFSTRDLTYAMGENPLRQPLTIYVVTPTGWVRQWDPQVRRQVDIGRVRQ